MAVFFCDNNLIEYESDSRFNESISYLEKKFKESKNENVLATLIGSAWLYLTEECRDNNDESIWRNLLFKWNYYMDIGLEQFKQSQIVNFIIGYSLYFDWIMVSDKKNQNISLQCLNSAKNLPDNILLVDFINWFTAKSVHRILNPNCEKLFQSNSLLEKHFKALMTYHI